MTVDIKKRLDEIGRLIKAGAKPSQFEKELNQLLGTEMEERDPEAEKRWEDSYRQNRETD
jgi:hypothetical protein